MIKRFVFISLAVVFLASQVSSATTTTKSTTTTKKPSTSSTKTCGKSIQIETQSLTASLPSCYLDFANITNSQSKLCPSPAIKIQNVSSKWDLVNGLLSLSGRFDVSKDVKLTNLNINLIYLFDIKGDVMNYTRSMPLGSFPFLDYVFSQVHIVNGSHSFNYTNLDMINNELMNSTASEIIQMMGANQALYASYNMTEKASILAQVMANNETLACLNIDIPDSLNMYYLIAYMMQLNQQAQEQGTQGGSSSSGGGATGGNNQDYSYSYNTAVG